MSDGHQTLEVSENFQSPPQLDPGPDVAVVSPQPGSVSPPGVLRPALDPVAEGGEGQEVGGKAVALPGMEGGAVNVLDRVRAVSAEARAVFEGRHEGDPDWQLYFDLVEERWPWRKAAYIAWCTMSRDRRQPDTEQKFAIKELGLTSARKIREWKGDNQFLTFIKDTAAGMMAAARLDVRRALIEAAANPNPRNHADRRMFMEMTGEYVPKQTVQVGTALPDNLSEMPEAEKRAKLAEIRRRRLMSNAE